MLVNNGTILAGSTERDPTEYIPCSAIHLPLLQRKSRTCSIAVA